MHPLSRTQSVLRFGAAFGLALAQACPLEAQESTPETLVETKLVAAEAVNGDEFGSALAISGDVMVVAAPWADTEGVDLSGAVYVYLRDPESGGWIEHQRLMPDDGDYHSFEMTLATDGATIVVGAPRATMSEFQDGAVHIFERDDTGIWSEAAKLSDASARVNGHFGAGIALDGDLLAIGAPQIGFDRHGFVGIFERDRGGDGAWGQVTTLHSFDRFVSAVDDQGHARSFGSAVALQGDLLVVGAARASVSYQDMRDGAAYVFRRDASNPDQWGFAGRIIAPGADTCTGGRKLSQFLLDEWNNPGVFDEALRCAQEDINTAFDAFGETVAIQGDLLAIGAPSAEGQTDEGEAGLGFGVVHLYRQDPSGSDQWRHVAALTGSAATESSWFGQDLATDGDRVIVGARGTAGGRGAAYVFEPDAGADSWAEAERLIAADGLSGARFGEAVALDGTTRLIGAGGADVARGAVYRHAAEPAEDPTFVATGTLTDASVVSSSEGARIAALEGSLASPIDVAIRAVAPPEEPLEGITALGTDFLVAAERLVLAPADKPFLVALPVPAGQDAAGLAAATLVSGEDVLDVPDSNSYWILTVGSYDASSGLYVIPLAALTQDPIIVRMLAFPTAEAPVAQSRSPVGLTQDSYDFHVMCKYPIGFPGCSPESRQLVKDELTRAYNDFVIDRGFPRPHLNAWVANFPLAPEVPFVSWGRVLGTVTLAPDDEAPCTSRGQAPEDGHYSANSHNITICIDRSTGDVDKTAETPQLLEFTVETIRHELFHAIQFAYARVREADKAERKWTLEGTASAAQKPSTDITRTLKRPLRPIGPSLVEDNESLEYQTQDFWVYFGMKNDLSIRYFKTLFEEGADTYAADRFFGSKHDTRLDLEYWARAKNQAMEKTFDFDGQLLNPCHVNAALIGTPQTLTYPPIDAEPLVEGTLERLASAVVKVIFREGAGPVTVSVDPAPNLRYKVYLEGDLACVVASEDTPRRFEQPPEQPVYVLLSNVLHQPGARVDYAVRVEEPTP